VYRVREVNINNLDVEKWNELLSRSEICDAFQTYEWAEVLRKSANVNPHFLVVQRNEEAIGGAIVLKKKMFKILDCYEVRGGPSYVRGEKLTVIKHLMKVMRRRKSNSVYSLFVPFPLINFDFREMLEREGYRPIPFRTIIINLEKPLDKIWSALNKKARWGVKKSEKLGVETRIADTWGKWEEFYRLHVLHSRKKQYHSEPYSFFEGMFKLHSKGMSRLFVALLGKRIIAGSLFLVYRKNMIFLQNASLPAFLSYNPNNLIQWRSIEWACDNGVTIYDLNGLPWEKTKYLRGVYEYKKRWDGRIKWYYYYINRRLLYSGVNLVRTNFVAWKLFAHLRNHRLV